MPDSQILRASLRREGQVAASPASDLCSTLVRLEQNRLFTTGRAEMSCNATVFTAKAGGKCGLFLNALEEKRGRLILFFPEEHPSAETRFHFEEFVLAQSRQGRAQIAQRFNAGNHGQHEAESYQGRQTSSSAMFLRP